MNDSASLLSPRFPEVVDSTMRSDFASCGRKFELSRVNGLAPLGGSVHLVAGGAFAKGCEVIRQKVYEEGMEEMDAIVEGVLAAWEHYGDFEPEDKYQTKSAERVAYALVEYFTEYPTATDLVQPYFQANGKPAIEFEFSFPLEVEHPETGNPLIYAGRFDMVGQYMDSLWVVDEKTATRLGPMWLKSFTLRGQLLGYCYAARQFGMPINGFIIRGISFLKDYYGHAEVIEPVPNYRLDQWWEQVNRDFQRAAENYKAGYFDFNFGDSCNSYNGCPYRTLCDKETWQPWWQGKFEISHWNPLTREEVKEDQAVSRDLWQLRRITMLDRFLSSFILVFFLSACFWLLYCLYFELEINPPQARTPKTLNQLLPPTSHWLEHAREKH